MRDNRKLKNILTMLGVKPHVVTDIKKLVTYLREQTDHVEIINDTLEKNWYSWFYKKYTRKIEKVEINYSNDPQFNSNIIVKIGKECWNFEPSLYRDKGYYIFHECCRKYIHGGFIGYFTDTYLNQEDLCKRIFALIEDYKDFSRRRP